MDTPLRIGNLTLANPFVVAPMAGVSDLVFRQLCREEGAAMAYTEMVSAKGLVRGGEKSRKFVARYAGETLLGVQLFGSDPAELGEAAAILEAEGRADLVDVNMGCPVHKVTKTGAGSALLCDPLKVGAVVGAIRRRTRLPVTIKIRAGWDARTVNAPEVARVAEDAGADAVALHPRTREQGYSGAADWDLVGETQAAVRIPILGSGDVVTPEQAVERARANPRGFVMIGRGATGRPWFFRQILARYRDTPVPVVPVADRLHRLTTHFRLYLAHHGEYRAVREFRKHLIWYAKGSAGAREIRGGVARLDTPADVEALLTRFATLWNDGLPAEPTVMKGDEEDHAYWEERGWG